MNMLLHGVKDTEFDIFHGDTLNISRYSARRVGEAEISLEETYGELVEIERAVQAATAKHNTFLKRRSKPTWCSLSLRG